jgi:cellobiose-specific phosphotransferase system component IIA
MPWKRIYKGLDAAKAKEFDTSELAIKQLSADLVDALQIRDSRYIIVSAS